MFRRGVFDLSIKMTPEQYDELVAQYNTQVKHALIKAATTPGARKTVALPTFRGVFTTDLLDHLATGLSPVAPQVSALRGVGDKITILIEDDEDGDPPLSASGLLQRMCYVRVSTADIRPADGFRFLKKSTANGPEYVQTRKDAAALRTRLQREALWTDSGERLFLEQLSARTGVPTPPGQLVDTALPSAAVQHFMETGYGPGWGTKGEGGSKLGGPERFVAAARWRSE